ncbi:hypothetical protein PGIGA_G00125760 [Pangasianodon gigas]|uniref:Uncharacterized protein n=1 Tax=Pangasianodon gigas TaxID=30993 RepID=A0ACC5XHJ0_PANGG|nr:hypothetical protein [Pangasianodon gigas]
MAERDAVPLPLDIRARIAELELELSEGEWRCPGQQACSTASSGVLGGGVCFAHSFNGCVRCSRSDLYKSADEQDTHLCS